MAEPAPKYSFDSCIVNNVAAAANEHTRDAVVALAEAVKANAEALTEIAKALKGTPATMDAAFKVN